ncbi:Uncharacterised protein [Bordetella pertussis]|nr:Uncharacterised protein [Bordetella pertussis]
MRAPVVIKAYPVADHAAGMLDGLEAMPMYALLFQRPDDAFDHAVLLWAVRRDELLAQTISPHQRGIAARGEDQAVVRSQQERRRHAAQRPEARYQGMLEGTARSASFTATRQVPAQQFTGVAVDHQRQRRPAVPTRPHPAQIRGPALIGHRCH